MTPDIDAILIQCEKAELSDKFIQDWKCYTKLESRIKSL